MHSNEKQKPRSGTAGDGQNRTPAVLAGAAGKLALPFPQGASSPPFCGSPASAPLGSPPRGSGWAAAAAAAPEWPGPAPRRRAAARRAPPACACGRGSPYGAELRGGAATAADCGHRRAGGAGCWAREARASWRRAVAAKHGPAAPPAQAGPRRPLAHLEPLCGAPDELSLGRGRRMAFPGRGCRRAWAAGLAGGPHRCCCECRRHVQAR